jgi:PAS domain S-box-containing protein
LPNVHYYIFGVKINLQIGYNGSDREKDAMEDGAMEKKPSYEELLQKVKQLEKEVAKIKIADEALRESEERFRKAFENAVIGRGLAEPGGTFIKVNDAFCKMLGYSNKEFLKKTWMDITHPDDLAESAGYAQRLIKGEIPSFNFVHRLIGKDGRIVWVDLNVVLVMDSRNRPLYVVGDIVDISGLKHVEEEHEKLIEELRKALAEVKTLQGILPICLYCKKIRDDEGFWEQVEVYINQRSEADFSHSICPGCLKEHYPKQFQEIYCK